MRVGVVGLGKLGLPLALCLAEEGFEVSGYDKDERLIRLLCGGNFFTHEPGVMDLLRNSQIKEKISFSDSPDNLCGCQIVYVIVPTPSNSTSLFDSSFVEEAIREILHVSVESSSKVSIVVVSTVMPGTCSNISQDIVGERPVKLIYSPEFIALGTVIQNLKYPDSILVGCASYEDAKEHIEVQRRIAGDVPISILNWDEAEVAKLLVNCYVTMKISFANFVGEICDILPEADPNKIAEALGADSRIGRKYLNPGLGYSGPCFPRDNAALSAWSFMQGVKADLALSTQAINERQPMIALNRISKLLMKKSSVLIIGLVYKPRTEVLDKSQSLQLARELKQLGHSIFVFDPYISEFDKGYLESSFDFLSSLSKEHIFDLAILSPGFEEYSKELGSKQKMYKFS